MRLTVAVLLLVLLAACGRGESVIEPGPGQPDDAASTSDPEPSTTAENDEVATVEAAPTTSSAPGSRTDDAAGDELPTTTVIIDQSSDNADEYTELAASGLVLSLDEQACADTAVTERLDAGLERTAAVIEAVQLCASPKAVDDFASVLISAGGQPLPPTEAACVASNLRSGEDYRPFWEALFAEEPFDFLAADLDVQNQYLDLYADCVSVGRALSGQIGGELSSSTVACIDDLYTDREFVRVTIEADLSGDAEEIDRINRQITMCLLPDERTALGLG